VSVLQDLLPLFGVILGGGLSTGTNLLLYRRQQRDAKDAERRDRDSAATSHLQETLASLLALDARPDESREIEEDRRDRSNRSRDDLPPEPEQATLDSWDRRHGDLVLAFQTASMDISDKILRSRLKRVTNALEYPYGPWDMARQAESSTRRIVCRHALECVGAYRRGDPLPPEEGQFLDTVNFVDDWIDWQEKRDRYEKEAQAQWFANRKSSSPHPVERGSGDDGPTVGEVSA
jgi:hypothetical protein